MGGVDFSRPTALIRYPLEWIGALAIGSAAAALVVGLAGFNPLLAVGVSLVIPVAALAVLRPRYGMLMLIFLIASVEEFRGGIGDTKVGGDEHLRSERTPFYAATLGIPAVYLPDVMIAVLLTLYAIKLVVWRERSPLVADRIGAGLALIAASIFVSVLVSLTRPDPFGPAVLDLSTLGSIKLPEKNVSDVARYFPILHFKLFALLFPSYLLGLFFFRDERDIRQTLVVVALAIAATTLIAGIRLAGDPSMVRNLVPVIFDTGSVTLLLMTGFYFVCMWSLGAYTPAAALPRFIVCGVLAILVLLSFRRTLWGAAALAALMLPFLVPSGARRKLILAGCAGAGLAIALLAVTPPGQVLLQSFLSRAGETNLNQSSTLYRFALLVWLVDRFDDLPLLGYGVLPLWDEIVRIRFFVISMENVHSLYLWILLRTGVVGLLAWGIALALILSRIRAVYLELDEARDRALVLVIFISIVLLLFNGIFNPVYANVRHIVPLGLSLALISRLPMMPHARRRRDGANDVPPNPAQPVAAAGPPVGERDRRR